MRRVLASLIVAALAAGAAPTVARASTAGDDLRAKRAALLTRIAAQTDEAEQAEAAVVFAQERQQRAGAALVTARQRLQERAIEAYMFGLTRSIENLAKPNVYLEDAFKADQRAIADLRAARTATEDAIGGAESASDASRAAQNQLEAERSQLEATIADQDALDAQLQAAAAARKAAEAAQAAVVDRFETDPAARTRHRVATLNQRALMARYPFGPVGGIPPGLRAAGQVLTGPASWYGPGFDGKRTSSGEAFDQDALTAAHAYWAFGTRVKVTFLQTGRSVVVRINDRFPTHKGRAIDLSRAAAKAIGLIGPGTGVVRLEVVG